MPIYTEEDNEVRRAIEQMEESLRSMALITPRIDKFIREALSIQPEIRTLVSLSSYKTYLAEIYNSSAKVEMLTVDDDLIRLEVVRSSARNTTN